MRENTVRVAKLARPAEERVVVGVDAIAGHRMHIEKLLDTLKVGLELSAQIFDALPSPDLQDGLGQALAEVGVMQGRAAHALALHHGDGLVDGAARGPLHEEFWEHDL